MAENETSSNSGAGSQTESKSTESKATESKATETSKSSGNFSGGFDSSALSDKSLSTDSTPDFGIDFGSNNNKSFGFGENLFSGSGVDFGKGLSDSGKTSETVSKSEPVMTVDEVYGKGNQSIVERQGDYAASSNEKSNVETSTFGKQDNISVTHSSDIPSVMQYICNQKEHHQKISFIDEYRQWLIEMGVSPDAPFFPK